MRKLSNTKKGTYQRSSRRNRKIDIIESKGGGCVLCGYNKCPEALLTHHLEEDLKEFNISDYSRIGGITKEDYKNELKKVIILCFNCHREVHAGITKLPEHLLKRLKIKRIDPVFFENENETKSKRTKQRRNNTNTSFLDNIPTSIYSDRLH